MSKLRAGQLTAAEYEQAALDYYRSLPLEHFMEATPQATQRKITLESLDLLQVRCPRVQVFSELLIQYLHDGELKRVVPDNMVILSDEPWRDRGSFNLELEPDPPFWVLEWVSSSSEGKDYNDSFRKYERELLVPYCLMYHPDNLDLRVYRHVGNRYQPLPQNANGRFAINELELEMGLVDRWVRFWHRQELLELPQELERRFQGERRRAELEEKRRVDAEAEVERLRALLKQSSLGATGNGGATP